MVNFPAYVCRIDMRNERGIAMKRIILICDFMELTGREREKFLYSTVEGNIIIIRDDINITYDEGLE